MSWRHHDRLVPLPEDSEPSRPVTGATPSPARPRQPVGRLMATTEPEVEDERGMGWPHHDGQGGIHDRLLDPCGGPPLIEPEAS